MKKRVEQVDTITGTREPLATFELVDGRVVATWTDADYQLEVEAMGVYLDAHGDVRPADGPLFFDALAAAYERSSLRYVVDA